jgi:hypothetical protein
MKNVKAVILVVLTVILVAALGYLTYLIQDGSDPLSMFNLRASNEQDEQDPLLAQNNLTSDPISPIPSPTTVLAYNSTSPTVTPSGISIT